MGRAKWQKSSWLCAASKRTTLSWSKARCEKAFFHVVKDKWSWSKQQLVNHALWSSSVFPSKLVLFGVSRIWKVTSNSRKLLSHVAWAPSSLLPGAVTTYLLAMLFLIFFIHILWEVSWRIMRPYHDKLAVASDVEEATNSQRCKSSSGV